MCGGFRQFVFEKSGFFSETPYWAHLQALVDLRRLVVYITHSHGVGGILHFMCCSYLPGREPMSAQRSTGHSATVSDPSEKLPVHKSKMWSREIQLAKMKKSDSPICLQKGGETGGWESEGRSDLVKFFKLFQNGRIWNSYMTESNSVEFFNVEMFLAENQTSKVKIPLF